MPAELAHRGAAHPVHGVRQVRVGEPDQDLLDVGFLIVVAEAVFGDQQLFGLLQDRADILRHVLVGHGLGDFFQTGLKTEVRGGSVPRVHGEELPLNVRRELVHEGYARNHRGRAGKRRPVDDPLVEGLHRDIQALPPLLVGHDPVHRGVRKHRRGVQSAGGVVPEPGHFGPENVRGVDGVLAGHNLQRRQPGRPRRDALGNGRRHELQDVRPHGGGDDVRRRDLRNKGSLLRARIQRAEVVHRPDGGVLPHLVDVVAARCRQLVDERARDIREHHLIAGLVQQQSNKPAADVPGSEMHCLHYAFTFPNRARTSSTDVASSNWATWALLVKTFAMEERMWRCSLLIPATPTTNLTCLPFQSMPSG